MARGCVLCLLGLLFLLTGSEIDSSEVTGLWVAERMDEREIGDDTSLTMEMTLADKKNRERKRKLSIIRKDFDGKDKLLLKFTYPGDIKGTSFLVWERKGKDNERFLYLPALGRIRRIATREKDQNFAGTDFSYEDISGRKLEDYTYELLEEEVTYQGRICYLLASYPKEKGSKYPKILSWVTKESFVVVKAQYHNKKGEIEKTYKVSRLEKIDGIWTTLEFSTENHKTKHRTFVTIEEIQYNRGIPEGRFERRELKR